MCPHRSVPDPSRLAKVFLPIKPSSNQSTSKTLEIPNFHSTASNGWVKVYVCSLWCPIVFTVRITNYRLVPNGRRTHARVLRAHFFSSFPNLLFMSFYIWTAYVRFFFRRLRVYLFFPFFFWFYVGEVWERNTSRRNRDECFFNSFTYVIDSIEWLLSLYFLIVKVWRSTYSAGFTEGHIVTALLTGWSRTWSLIFGCNKKVNVIFYHLDSCEIRRFLNFFE